MGAQEHNHILCIHGDQSPLGSHESWQETSGQPFVAAILISDSGCKEEWSNQSTKGQPLNLIWNGNQPFLWTPWGSRRETKEEPFQAASCGATGSQAQHHCSAPREQGDPLTYSKLQRTAAHSSRMHHLSGLWLRKGASSHRGEIYSITFHTTPVFCLSQVRSLSSARCSWQRAISATEKQHGFCLVNTWGEWRVKNSHCCELSVSPLFLQQARLQEGPVWLKFNYPTPRDGHHLGEEKNPINLLQASNCRALEME